MQPAHDILKGKLLMIELRRVCGDFADDVGFCSMTLGDLKFLKELKAAGDLGRNVRELTIRITLDRLVKGGYLVGRPTDRHSVQYRITQRGRDAIAEHDF
jgi:hypothetical protein